MKKIFYLLLFLSLTQIGKAQKSQYLPYGFKKIQTLTAAEDEKFKKHGSLVLNETRIIDFSYNEKHILECNFIYHLTTKVYNQNGIDDNNRIYLSLDEENELIDLKARFISKDNKITEVNKNNIKTVENLENKGDYKIFAIEGVEVDGIIDYYYVIKRPASLYKGYYLQSDVPKYNVDLTISLPSNLRMVTKSYNGLNDMKDTLREDIEKRIYTLNVKFIPELESEKYSMYKSNLQRLEYVICYNYNKNRTRFYTFNEAAQNFYENINNIEKPEQKAIKKLISEVNISNKLSAEEKIRKVEIYVKTHISYIKKDGPEFSNIEKICTNKYANSHGFTTLFLNIFKELEIDAQPVITCNKAEKEFDKNFDSWNSLTDNLIYFPEIKKFMIPDHWAYRLGFIPDSFIDNFGLFFKRTKVADIESYIPELKRISVPTYQESADSIFLEVNFIDDYTNSKSKLRRVLTGYSASEIQPYYKILEADSKKDILKQFAALGIETAKTENLKIDNIETEDFFVKPFILNCDIENPGFVEKAGANLLVKVGEMIGPQAELYNEKKERKLDVVHDHNRHYYRKLVIHLPKGFKPQNLNDFNMNVNTNDGDFPSAAFISKASINGDVLVIDMIEYYSKMKYKASEYEVFRAVINAAADFNKKTLIFSEKL
ncbi:MAG: DUF3857 domain-containing protein [Bacteroidetes bacterium]|nr:DUF3857 domain-containing protein [Bacteroidota bacterium]